MKSLEVIGDLNDLINDCNEEINRLKETIIKEHKESGNNALCSICYQIITKNNKTILSCNHMIHSECYTKMVIHNIKNKMKDIKCPLCRDIIVETDEEDEENIEIGDGNREDIRQNILYPFLDALTYLGNQNQERNGV